MAFGTAAVILITRWLQGMGASLAPLPTALLALPSGIAPAAALVLATDRANCRCYRTNFLYFSRFGFSASGPRRRFLSSS